MRRRWWIGGGVLVVAICATLYWRAQRPAIPAPEAAREAVDVEPSGSRGALSVTRQPAAAEEVRRLAAENLALWQERAALKKALLTETAPVVPGLPTAPPSLYSPEESRIIDEIANRVFAEAREKIEPLYRQVKGEPPAGATPEMLFGTLLDSSGVTDVKDLVAHISAIEKLKERNAPPGPDAPLAQRVLWFLTEAGDAVEREVREALPPARHEELRKLPKSGFGYSISQTNGHWVVAPSRPHT
jgi:hypothetical protein